MTKNLSGCWTEATRRFRVCLICEKWSSISEPLKHFKNYCFHLRPENWFKCSVSLGSLSRKAPMMTVIKAWIWTKRSDSSSRSLRSMRAKTALKFLRLLSQSKTPTSVGLNKAYMLAVLWREKKKVWAILRDCATVLQNMAIQNTSLRNQTLL